MCKKAFNKVLDTLLANFTQNYKCNLNNYGYMKFIYPHSRWQGTLLIVSYHINVLYNIKSCCVCKVNYVWRFLECYSYICSLLLTRPWVWPLQKLFHRWKLHHLWQLHLRHLSLPWNLLLPWKFLLFFGVMKSICIEREQSVYRTEHCKRRTN